MTHQHWTRRDKRTAWRAGHGILSKPFYRGEDYNQRLSMGRYLPEDTLFDNLTPFDLVCVLRGRVDRQGALRAPAQEPR